MKIAKKLAYGLAGVVALAAAIQLAAPRTVHAVVSTLVTVVGSVAVTNPANSSGAPQPLVTQDSEHKAYLPFRMTTDCTFDVHHSCLNAVAQVTGTQVLVINDVSGTCSLPPSGEMASSQVNLYDPSTGTAVSYAFPPVSAGESPTQITFIFGRQTYIVLDSTYTTLSSFVQGTVTPFYCNITYSGYYVSPN